MSVRKFVSIEMDSESIIQAFCDGFDTDQLIEFVKELDEEYSDWDATNELYEFFKKRHEAFLEENDMTEEDYREEYKGIFTFEDKEEDVWEDEDDEVFQTDDVFTTAPSIKKANDNIVKLPKDLEDAIADEVFEDMDDDACFNA